MKVIQQLIQYFADRGSLSAKEIDYLSDRGFWTPPHDDHHCPDYDLDELIEDEGEEWWEHTEERLAKPRGKGKRSSNRKANELDRDALLEALAEQFTSWENSLRGLVELAPHGENWKDAAVAIRQADNEVLHRELRKQLTKGSLALPTLWDSLQFEGYREAVNLAEFTGAVANAYRLVLTGRIHSELGRFTWILRHREVRAVYNLLHAQRRISKMCAEFFAAEPKIVSRAIRRHPNPSVFWSFVLLYNADRYEKLGFDTQSDLPTSSWVRGQHTVLGGGRNLEEEYAKPHDPTERPPIPWPCPDQLWQQAWSNALLMAPRQVTPLFAKFYGGETEPQSKPTGTTLWCPNGWRPQ